MTTRPNRSRRYYDAHRSRATAEHTRTRFTEALKKWAQTVTFTPSEIGPEWKTLKIDGHAVTVRFGDGAAYLWLGMGKTRCLPLPKRTRGGKIVQTFVYEVTHPVEMAAKQKAELKARREAAAKQRAEDEAIAAAEQARKDARDAKQKATQTVCDAMLEELDVSWQVRCHPDHWGTTQVQIDARLTPEQVRKLVEFGIAEGLLSPLHRPARKVD